jgi:hypothetical protein
MEKRGDLKKRYNLKIVLVLGFFLSLGGGLLAQRGPRILVVNGTPIRTPVRQIDGHSYVDIETLAQITRGSVKIEGNRIVLTIPDSSTAAMTVATAATGPRADGLSKDFAAAAMIALSNIKEWKAGLEAMVVYGLAMSPRWAQDYRERAKLALSEAATAATTPSDLNALQLLNHQVARLAKWADGIIAERRDLNGARTVDPDSLRTDPAFAKISECDRFLNSVLIRGNIIEGTACR